MNMPLCSIIENVIVAETDISHALVLKWFWEKKVQFKTMKIWNTDFRDMKFIFVHLRLMQ